MAGRDSFLAFVADEVTRAALVRVAESRGLATDSVLQGGLTDAIRALGAIPTPRTLICDIGAGDPLAGLASLSQVCDPETRVVALGAVNDVNLFRDILALGVEDYLVKPVSAEALDAAVARLITEPAKTATEGRLVAVVGARGGVGATTVATNIAWSLAHEQGRNVALVDLDLFFGDVALSLDLEPGRGFLEALENPGRIDGLFIERAMVKASERLSVLSAEESIEQGLAFDPKAMDLLLGELRRGFEDVVIDLPRFAARTQLPLLSPPSRLAIVSALSLAGMRDTMRLADFAAKARPDAEVSVIANRANAGGMSRVDFERGTGRPVDHMIPDDPKAVAIAAGRGKPLVHAVPRGKTARALGGLAASPDAGGAAPGWRRLLGRSA